MPHIALPDSVPGIRSLVIYRPETGKYLYELVQLLLRGESSLSSADRELIATYVSYLNNCDFCYQSHAAAARCLYGEQQHLVDEVLKDLGSAPVSPKLKALLAIAGKVQKLGKEVKPEDIEKQELRVQVTVISMIRYLLLQPFACLTGMLTDLQPLHRNSYPIILPWESA